MEIITDIRSLRLRLKSEHYVVFVPTMGNLHEGHLSLIQEAKNKSGCLVASIFVNPLQFESNGDFNQYPRTLENDFKLLNKNGVDIVFAPTEKEIYPVSQEFFVEPMPLANILEGEFRPGFFRGVTTLVLKFFNLVQPQLAIFGKKDYQQLCIVHEMVRQLNLSIEINSVETIRAADGLALSSRNQYLNNEERVEATRLYQVLTRIKNEILTGNRDFKMLQDAASKTLSKNGWKVDYIILRQRDTLDPIQTGDQKLVVLGAAKLGVTRLIDNLEITSRS